MLIGELAVIAFGVIDTAMVGRFSATDLAVLGLGSSVYISVLYGPVVSHRSTSYTFMALFISHFGTTTLAGHQIAGNLGAVLYMTPLSHRHCLVDARVAGATRKSSTKRVRSRVTTSA